LRQVDAIAQRVVAADGDHVVDAQPLQVGQHLRRQVVDLVGILVAQVQRHILGLDMAGAGAGRVQEGAAGAPGAVHHVLSQHLKILFVVVIFFAHDLDGALPAAADTDHLIALAQRADGDRANGGIQAGHVAASGQDADGAFVCVSV
jgi:hypothetical protein